MCSQSSDFTGVLRHFKISVLMGVYLGICLVFSWGRNQNGQLGLGHTEDVLVPCKVAAFEVCISFF